MTMTNPLIIIGAILLLVVKPACLAFQQPPLSCCTSSTDVTSLVSRQTPKYRNSIGSRTTTLARASSSSSSFEDNNDDEEGYEIRRDASVDSRRRRQSTSLRVETTFGAENVPVEQRPSNEYLNLIQQPTFAWASQESGDGGLVLRLAVTYIALFVLV